MRDLPGMSAPLAAAPVQTFDRHFAWRGHGVTRLEGFADAVFAIVLALLFLRASPPESFGDLKAAMKALVPFAATFAIVAYVWAEHWLFARRYGLTDGLATVWHLLLLFLLLFYAYPLKFLCTLLFVAAFGPIGTQTLETMSRGFSGTADLTQLFVFYGAGYGSIFGVLALLYHHALGRSDALQLNRVERFLTRSAILQCSLQVAIVLTSIGLASAGLGLGFGLPGWVYVAIGPLMAVHGSWERGRLRRLLGQ